MTSVSAALAGFEPGFGLSEMIRRDIDLKQRTLRIEESKGLRSRVVFLRDCFLKPFESEMKAGFLAKNHRIWAKLLDSLGYQQANDSKNRLKKHSLSQSTIEALHQLPKISEYVFTYNNLPLSNRYCQSRLKTLGRKCGIQVTPHQLPHTCASLLLNAGMSVFGVQSVLGHRYVATSRYAKAHDTTLSALKL
jgi:integrase